MARIVGLLFSGFMVRLYAAALALYVGLQGYHYVMHVFGAASAIQQHLG